jgi:branched-chain amino acid transport system ATP-binding protein
VNKLLAIENIHVLYGESHVLHGVSIAVDKGKVVALLGRNGVGKSTTLQAVLGIPAPLKGDILFNGRRISGLSIAEITRLGIAWVPQGHRIFSSLTVEENIALASVHGRIGPWTINKILNLFPSLQNRLGSRGGTLSGGEQQMLAIARALVQNPELILMDEPSEGLSPRLVNEVGDIVARLNSEGCSILLVEQNLAFAQRLAHHVCVMNKGAIVCEGSPEDIDRDPAFRRYLSVNASADRSPAAISLN